VDLKVPPLSDLAVSLYFPGETGPPTSHGTGLHTTYVSREGDFTGQPAIADPAFTTLSYYWLAAVDVQAPAGAAALITFGDSITDGTASTPNADHSWAARLAARLAKDKKTALVGVANMGISGNRVLYDGSGASALARFDRDVLSQSGVKWVMLLEGINDIGRVGTPTPEAPTAEDLIAAYRQIVEIAHTHGIKVIGCTLTPYEGAGYSREAGEAVREAVNAFIRTGGAFDAVADFEAVTRDPRRLRSGRPPAPQRCGISGYGGRRGPFHFHQKVRTFDEQRSGSAARHMESGRVGDGRGSDAGRHAGGGTRCHRGQPLCQHGHGDGLRRDVGA
jgi:lysophospholipase L1-like esterase